LPFLCKSTENSLINIRNGSIIGIAHILIGLSGNP